MNPTSANISRGEFAYAQIIIVSAHFCEFMLHLQDQDS